MKVNRHRLSWYRWEWKDPVQKDKWTACTVSVYEPTYELPFVSVLVSIANGGGRVLMRCSSIEEARQRVVIPEAGLERLELALTKSMMVLEELQRDLRLIADSRSLREGGKLVRTDTGEVIAEAERVIKEHRKGELE